MGWYVGGVILWLIIAVLLAAILVSLNRIDEEHKPFQWTRPRIKMVLFAIVWPVSVPTFIVFSWLRDNLAT